MKKKLKDFKGVKNTLSEKTEIEAEIKVDETEKRRDKKKSSKAEKIVWGIMLLIVVGFIYYEVSPFFILPNEVRELNQNLDLPFDFGVPLEQCDFTGGGWKKEQVYNGVLYEKTDSEYFIFRGFPDLSTSYKLINYWTDNSKTLVFGFRVGDSMKKVKRLLKKHGYKQISQEDCPSGYHKGRVTIILDEDPVQKKVEGISVELSYTDWFHKGYYK
jgi:hypothetical protein